MIACLIAFLLDNTFSHGSFLLGLVAALPVTLFVSLPFSVAIFAAFGGGLLVDSIYLTLPFGLSAIYAAGVLFTMKIFHTFFNRNMKNFWMAMVVICTLVYYLLLNCVLPFLHPRSFSFAVLESMLYNYVLWLATFGFSKPLVPFAGA
jgi:hypothetical protein